jgi:aerobic-type carbon monoxide dehydrogenase small subunit (CoxS/CutS family)
MTGTKYGCGIAQCGACTVHVGGEVRSCQYPVSALGDLAVVTIEAVGSTPNGRKIQQARSICNTTTTIRAVSEKQALHQLRRP